MADASQQVESTDKELAKRSREGCEVSFGVLARRYQTPLLHFLCNRMRNKADAEGVLQDTFIRACQHLG